MDLVLVATALVQVALLIIPGIENKSGKAARSCKSAIPRVRERTMHENAARRGDRQEGPHVSSDQCDDSVLINRYCKLAVGFCGRTRVIDQGRSAAVNAGPCNRCWLQSGPCPCLCPCLCPCPSSCSNTCPNGWIGEF